MYEGSQFFRTTTGIHSGPGTFDESRFVMIFLTIFRVTKILCSSRLLLNGKMGKDIHKSLRLKLLKKFLATNFSLSDGGDNTSGPLNRGGIVDIPSF